MASCTASITACKATSDTVRSEHATLVVPIETGRFAAARRGRGRGARCDRPAQVIAVQLQLRKSCSSFLSAICVSIRQPMKMQLARSLLLFGLIIAGCGPSHKGVPVDGLPAGDARAQPSDGQIFEDAPQQAQCGLASCMSQNATCGPIGDGCGARSIVELHLAGDLRRRRHVVHVRRRWRWSVYAAHVRGSGRECGVSDGCGDLTASCGTCPTGETCGARRREHVRDDPRAPDCAATERVHDAEDVDQRHDHGARSRRHRDVGPARSDLRRARLRAERRAVRRATACPVRGRRVVRLVQLARHRGHRSSA